MSDRQQQQQQYAERNRTNQCNKTHKPSGPGHQRGFTGDTYKEAMNNHAEQKNPNNPKFAGQKK